MQLGDFLRHTMCIVKPGQRHRPSRVDFFLIFYSNYQLFLLGTQKKGHEPLLRTTVVSSQFRHFIHMRSLRCIFDEFRISILLLYGCYMNQRNVLYYYIKNKMLRIYPFSKNRCCVATRDFGCYSKFMVKTLVFSAFNYNKISTFKLSNIYDSGSIKNFFSHILYSSE